MRKIDLIQHTAISFIQEHWEEIDKRKTDLSEYSKEKTFNLIIKDKSFAEWVVIEVMDWGCEKNYLKPFIVECEDLFVMKIEDKYFKLKDFRLIETFPKEKTIIYFD